MMASRYGRKPRRFATLCVALALAGVLAGCAGMQDTLGLGKTAPDEFRVVSNQPLSMPPEYDLRPPGDGEDPRQAQEPSARDRAQQAVFRRDGANGDAEADYDGRPGMSPGERALLSRAGAGSAPENIRQIIEAESRQARADEGSLMDSLMFWRSDDVERGGEPLDARSEVERLESQIEDLERVLEQDGTAAD